MTRRHLAMFFGAAALFLSAATARADEADVQYAKGLQLMKAGQLEAAQAAIEAALRLRPGYVAAELSLGNVLRKRKQCDRAIPHYQVVVKADAKSGLAWGNLGVCQFQVGNRAAATASLARAVELEPSEAQWRYSLGALYRQDKQYDKALPHLEKAAALEPKNPDALRNLAVALGMLKQWERAVDVTKQAIALAPSDSNLRFDLGVLYRRQKKTTEAIAAYREAVKLDAKNAPAWFDLGVMLAEMRSNAEAREAYERFIELVKDRSPADAESARQRIKALR